MLDFARRLIVDARDSKWWMFSRAMLKYASSHFRGSYCRHNKYTDFCFWMWTPMHGFLNIFKHHRKHWWAINMSPKWREHIGEFAPAEFVVFLTFLNLRHILCNSSYACIPSECQVHIPQLRYACGMSLLTRKIFWQHEGHISSPEQISTIN